MLELKPPKPIPQTNDPIVFAGGSIEMGVAEDWQTKLCKHLKEKKCVVLNPRRDFWDENWKQRMSDENFNEQVTWELDGLDTSDIIVMYFDPKTKSPISLLELGLHAKDEKLIVCCPDGFYRKGNVEIVCKRYNIPLFNDFDELLKSLTEAIDKIADLRTK